MSALDAETLPEVEDGSGVLRFIPGAFRCTETGNAERLVARYRGDVHYVSRRERWLIWNGREWEWDERRRIETLGKVMTRGIYLEAGQTADVNVRKALLAWAGKSEAASKRAAAIALARSEAGITITLEELDLDPWVLNCANGTLDLRTGELREARRADMITKTTGVAYKPGASSVLWLRVVHNMTGGNAELASYLQRVAGYALAGVATERRFFFLYGPPGSGKSTFLESLHACMGTYACSTSFETWLERTVVGGNRDDLVALQGIRLVTSGEVGQSKHWNAALIKQITGGDRISAAAKYEKPVEFIPACTILLAANDAPKARDDDAGLWERMQRIPIEHVVPVEDRIKDLHRMLREPEHAEAILAWAVEGCAAWQLNGIGVAAVVTASTEAYREENDWIAGFLDGFTLDPYSVIPARQFRDHYETYCKQEGQKPETTKGLARRIEKRYPTVRFVAVHGVRQWQGLKHKTEPAAGVQQEMPAEERWT